MPLPLLSLSRLTVCAVLTVALVGCAASPSSPGAQGRYGVPQRQADPLTQTARDLGSIERIIGSGARIGRTVTGGGRGGF